jgi:predicted nucleotidyltransferase
MTHLELARTLATQYSQSPVVQAVVLSGSQTNGLAEASSDIDLYVYSDDTVPLAFRQGIAKDAPRTELNNQYWETEDDWLHESGIQVEVIYRSRQWLEEQLGRVLEHHQASVGYSTCFWHNVITSNILFDRALWFTALQTKATQPYPEQLKHAIIAKNFPLLRDSLTSYLGQLDKAVKRSDLISINHRVAALLASYFDILFAVNEVLHPGEKRLIDSVRKRCQRLPRGFPDDVETLLSAHSGAVLPHANKLIDKLEEWLEAEGLHQK